jgi:hypothetical protein
MWCAGGPLPGSRAHRSGGTGANPPAGTHHPGEEGWEMPQHRSLTSCEILRALTSVETGTAERGTHLCSCLILGSFS